MGDTSGKIQLPFHNGQAVTRRLRPTRSVVSILGLVLFLLILTSWTSSSKSTSSKSTKPFKSKEDELHEALDVAPSKPQGKPEDDGPCEGFKCYAYSQHATHATFLCNALMIFESLHRTGSDASRVLMHNQEWTPGSKTYTGKLLAKARDEYKVKLVPVRVAHTEGEWTWQETFAKLYAFSQDRYKRILALDSDSVLLQHMDDLFESTPPAKLSATVAYWLPELKLSSNVLLIEPDKADFDRVLAAIGRRMPFEYDTEIINSMFGKGATLIPHRRNNLITGEFRAGDHSKYMGDEPWNATAVLEEARFIHFSDLMSPKPWTSENPADVTNTVVPCWKHPDSDDQDCSARDAWLWLYREHLRRRTDICNPR